ncbi:MAG: restriction endonuclease subunit S [Thiomicrorhabdus sp.]|nr:restriction endonuclease subunit S [Thiomicrorhabdus sp.]
MSWTDFSINSVAEVVTKGTTPTTYGMPFTEEGVNFIKAEALNGDATLDNNGFTYISEDTHEKLKRSQLCVNDVLITIAGANVGKCGIVREQHIPANTNQAVGIIRVDPKKASPRFIYYCFKNPRTFAVCQGMGGQAAQPNINLTVLKSFVFSGPENPEEQEKIAELIAKYDDLIENNRRRIQLLEESARLLYQEWFVHLRFPGHEQVTVTDGVPDGWIQSSIGEESSYLNRGIAPKYSEDGEFIVINQKCIRNRVLSLELARKQSKEFKEEKTVRIGDVLINSTGTGTLGRVAQVWEEFEKVCVDTHVTIVRPAKDVPYLWLGYCLLGMERRLEDMGEGATNQKELKRQHVADIPILRPPNTLMELFHNNIIDNTKQIQNLIKMNKFLSQARDLLLPKLMSGELTI